MDRWSKVGFREIRNTKLEKKNTNSKRMEDGVGGGENS